MKTKIVKSDINEDELNLIKNEDDHFVVQYKSGDFIMLYEARTNDKTTVSFLTIRDQPNQSEPISKTTYIVNTDLTSYKLASHEDVISEAEKIKRNFDSEKIQKIVTIYEIFGRKVLSDERINIRLQSAQSLFYHNAILNTVNRSLKNTSDCECTPHPAYFIDKTGFWCQEDFLIDPQAYIKAIDNSNYVLNKSEKKMYEYLQNNRHQTLISIDNVLSVIESKEYFKNRVGNVYYKSTSKALKNNPPSVQRADCTQGSDLGCCGNYAGCCWYFSIFCFAHDVECLASNCQPRWYCLPGCRV